MKRRPSIGGFIIAEETELEIEERRCFRLYSTLFYSIIRIIMMLCYFMFHKLFIYNTCLANDHLNFSMMRFKHKSIILLHLPHPFASPVLLYSAKREARGDSIKLRSRNLV